MFITLYSSTVYIARDCTGCSLFYHTQAFQVKFQFISNIKVKITIKVTPISMSVSMNVMYVKLKFILWNPVEKAKLNNHSNYTFQIWQEHIAFHET